MCKKERERGRWREGNGERYFRPKKEIETGIEFKIKRKKERKKEMWPYELCISCEREKDSDEVM